MNTLTIPKDDFQRRILQGVFRRAWRMTGFGLMGFVYTWLLSLWVLQFFQHPGFLMGFGILYALAIGLWLGSGTQHEEGEEMLFSLPPTRAQIYWVQAAVGSLPLLLLCTLGVWALRTEAPQALWGLFVTSGFTEPFRVRKVHLILLPLSVGVPMLLFACVYGLSALAVNRNGAVLALIVSGMITAALTMGGILLESLIWQFPRGGLSAALMLALAALILWACGRGYQLKEGNPGPATTNSGSKAALIVGILVIVLVFLLFFWSFGPTSSAGPESLPATLEVKESVTQPTPSPLRSNPAKAGE